MANCVEENCTHPPADFIRLALQAPNGSMTVEVLLCELHIATLELANSGQYLFVRKRLREDGFLR